MADTSARLVDDVFPSNVPVRQWVLSLPIQIRYRLSYDSTLLEEVLRTFLNVVQGWYQQQGREIGIARCEGGSVTFCQRFGSGLNLNPHFHTLVLDGTYNAKNKIFHAAPTLQDVDVKEIVETTARKVIELLQRKGVLNDCYDRFADEQPLLSRIAAASIMGLAATGDRAGMRIRRVLEDPAEAIRTGPLCYASSGFSLHAATRISAGDKIGLERLCKYVSRPPLAQGSLQQNANGEYVFKLKTPWDDGTSHLIFSWEELVERLAALVPPPRTHLIRYYGVLAPHAKDRDKVVPQKPEEEELQKTRGKSKNRFLWAALLTRTFGFQVETCPRCHGKMRMVAALTDPCSVRRYLEGVGLSAATPVLIPARPPPQLDLDW
jgi:hypothetical protein